MSLLFHFLAQIRAAKCNNPDSFIEGDAVLIVADINDNHPLIYFSNETPIKINEEQFSTLFTSLELYIEDLDLVCNTFDPNFRNISQNCQLMPYLFHRGTMQLIM